MCFIHKQSRWIIHNQFQEEKPVTQYHYIGWPDHGIPTTTSSMIKLRKLVNDEYDEKQNKGPIIVHCR